MNTKQMIALLTTLVLCVAIGAAIGSCQQTPEPEIPPLGGGGELMEEICIRCRAESRYFFGADITFYSDEESTQTLNIDGATGSIDSEGDGDFAGDLAVGDDSTFTGDLDVTGATTLNSTLDVDGNISSGTGSVTVTDSLNVTGAVDLDSTLNVDGVSTLVGAIDAQGNIADSGGDVTVADNLVVSGGDMTVSADSTGGNAGAKNEFIGLPRITMTAFGLGTDGTGETVAYIDSTPTGEWAAAGISVTVGADTSIYRVGTNSLVITFAISATAGSGVTGTISSDDLSTNESIGFWAYATTEVISGDLEIQLTDDDASTPPTTTVGITLTENTWTWVETDISDCDGGGTDCNAVTEVLVLLTTQGASNLGEFNLYLDGMYKWDSDDEEALGQAIQTDGVLAVMAVVDAQDQTNTQSILAEYTDYFVNYESGNDFIVWISDQSAKSSVALIAY
jgi:cytoskeletal protein CcmA (bactofilin family)